MEFIKGNKEIVSVASGIGSYYASDSIQVGVVIGGVLYLILKQIDKPTATMPVVMQPTGTISPGSMGFGGAGLSTILESVENYRRLHPEENKPKPPRFTGPMTPDVNKPGNMASMFEGMFGQ